MLRDLESELETIKARLELVPVDLEKLRRRRPDVDSEAVLRFVDAHRGDPQKARSALIKKSLNEVIDEFGSPSQMVEEQTTSGKPAVPWSEGWSWRFGDGRGHLWIGVRNGRIISGGIYEP